MSTNTRQDIGSMEPIAASIESLGSALQALTQRPSASGSRRQLSHADYTLTGAWAKRPLLESYTLATMNTAQTADCLLGLAACIRAPGVIFSTITVYRSLLESTAHAFYLWSDTIDTRERVRRWANLMLVAEMETLKMVVGPDADERDAAMEAQQRRTIDELVETARLHGFTVKIDPRIATKPVIAEPPYLDAKTPRIMKLVDELLQGEDGIGVGKNVYRLASSVAHAQFHGQKTFWMMDEKVGSGQPGVSHVPIGVSGQDLVSWLAPGVVATHTLALRIIAANGWTDAVWQKTAQPILHTWREWLSGSTDSVSVQGASTTSSRS